MINHKPGNRLTAEARRPLGRESPVAGRERGKEETVLWHAERRWFEDGIAAVGERRAGRERKANAPLNGNMGPSMYL